MKKYTFILLWFAVLPFGFAQVRDGKVWEQIEAQKVAFFTSQLDLSVAESQAFWPIYNAHQEKLRKLKTMYRTDMRDQDVTDEEAQRMISEFFEMQEKELDLTRTLYSDLKDILPPRKIVKLHQAENLFKQRILEKIKERRNTRTPAK